ncbi:MAG: hypothetical protein VKO65_08825 [Cyanobacteriota bacterium]|nr:hypothetical protein [Cyanobacteriota bacterium]
MALIPAVVLTYDANHRYALHMIRLYERLWPDHPFQFHIPFQGVDRLPGGAALGARIQMRATPGAIRQTVLTLLDQFDDDQWIYWCVDDKYPLSLDTAYLRALSRAVLTRSLPGIDGICFCRARKLRDGRALMTGRSGLWKVAFCPSVGFLFRRSDYSQIWLHQFVRVRVLRSLFASCPDAVNSAKELDGLKDRIPLPDSHRIFVTRGHHASFGESSSRGVVTANCAASMLREGIEPPGSGGVPAQHITIGDDAAGLNPGLCWRDLRSILAFGMASSLLRLKRCCPFR